MRRFHWLAILGLLGDVGLSVRADPPARQASPGSAAAVARRGLLSRFRRPDTAVPPGPPPAASEPQPAPPGAVASRTAPDPPVRRAQAGAGDLATLRTPPPDVIPAMPEASLPAISAADVGSQSLTLQAALYGALTGNPDLVSLRAGNVPGSAASPEAVEVARRFPTTLNPTLWVDVRPWGLERVPGGVTANGTRFGPRMDHKDALMYFSLRQPLELGHQTRYRHAIAKAALNQQRWTVLQAELLTLVQTYRFFQTAAYRREKLRVARELADFNDRLVGTLRRRLEANQVTADAVTLAEVEAEATRQLAHAAEQDYSRALTDLRNQIGAPGTAGSAEPLGEFILPAYIPPVDDQALIQTALQSRPEIHAARAQVEGARAAIGLARGDRIPTPVVGPVYERDEQGTQFFGFVYITPIPVVNGGQPLVRQREAEYRRACVALEQVQKRTVAQVQAAIANWNQANELSRQTRGLTEKLRGKVESMERLFDAGQTDLTRLLQARQRLIQLENAELDATWQATQAQADLLTALGAPTLIQALERSATAAGATAPPGPPPAADRPPFTTPPGTAPAPR
jgi:cobalt-zinc-cadmium efflux system outer membrane protein